ncbi:MAG TPA: glycosyltransferase family 2 protein [Opitutaceae bacterium]|nr:glycosyltransferase family 2 protein [Opitutaceae bacterium]
MIPDVSVLLPVYNAAGTLPAALASLRAQTLVDWELLAVDDGSTDATPILLSAAAAADPRIRVLAQPHSGIVAALNLGLSAARTPLVARFDADDECHPERLARQVAFLRDHPEIGLCATQVAYGGDTAANRGYALHVEWTNALLSPAEIALNRFIESPVAHPSVMFRRELVAAHGGYREHAWPEDYEMWLRWLDAGVNFAKIPAPLVRWNDPPQRLSRTHPRYAVDAFYACKCHYLARWLRHELALDRPLYLRGAGKVTRRRFAALAAEGVRLAGYVDVAARKLGARIAGLPVLAPEAVPPAGECFILGAVGTRGARDFIRAQLRAQGRSEGRDFLMVA